MARQKTKQNEGLRTKVTRVIGESTGRSKSSKQPKLVTRTIDSFKTAAAKVDGRVRGSQRSEAGKKAARTRKRNAAQRSASARKGARTRAKANR